jgi:phosphate/sulfate permease
MEDTSLIFGVLFGYVFFSVIAGIIASKKGQSGIGFIFLSLALSPIIGITIALIMKPSIKVLEQKEQDDGISKKCPFCAELVKKEASICRFCGRDISKPTGEDGPLVYEIDPSTQRISTDKIKLNKEPGKVGNAYNWAIKHPFKTFLIFIVIIWLIGSMTHTKSDRLTTSNMSYIKISLEQLNNEYKANEIAADQKYKNKMLEVSGTVCDIEQSSFITPANITLWDAGSHLLVMCSFSKKNKNQLVNLSKGQHVNVKGKCSANKDALSLEDCTL